MPNLRVVEGAQKGQVFVLKHPGPYRIGRDPKAHFPLYDRWASRQHCRIDFRDQGHRASDLESRGGMFVNDKKVQAAFLAHGDIVRIGRTRLQFGLSHPEDPLLERQLGGYRVLERVGSGGMGRVYRAEQRALSRIVALKVLPESVAENQDACTRFIQEARAAAKLTHENIVRVYDVHLVDSVLFYSMEFMARGSVLDLLRRKGRLSLRRVLAIGLDAARAIEFAEGVDVIHRDVKPANLLVHQEGRFKLSDLGIATTPDDVNHRASPGSICGSPHYMSPEQALGRAVDSRADLYSLGATLYELIAGHPPFALRTLQEVLKAQVQETPPSLEKVRAETPPGVAHLVATLMAKKPEDRPRGSRQVVEQLEELCDQVAESDPLEVETRRRLLWRRRWLTAVGLLGGLVGLAVARALLHSG